MDEPIAWSRWESEIESLPLSRREIRSPWDQRVHKIVETLHQRQSPNTARALSLFIALLRRLKQWPLSDHRTLRFLEWSHQQILTGGSNTSLWIRVLGNIAQYAPQRRFLWSATGCAILFPVSDLSPKFSSHTTQRFQVSLEQKNIFRARHPSEQSLARLVMIRGDPEENLYILKSISWTLCRILYESQSLLQRADDRIADSVFLGYAQQVGVALYQLHQAIFHSLTVSRTAVPEHPDASIARIGLLRVVAMMLKNVPYEDLSGGYLHAALDLLHENILHCSFASLREVEVVLECYQMAFSRSYHTEIVEWLETAAGGMMLQQLMSWWRDRPMTNENIDRIVLSVWGYVCDRYRTCATVIRILPDLCEWMTMQLGSLSLESSGEEWATSFFELVRVLSASHQSTDPCEWRHCVVEYLVSHLVTENSKSSLLGSWMLVLQEFTWEEIANQVSEDQQVALRTHVLACVNSPDGRLRSTFLSTLFLYYSDEDWLLQAAGALVEMIASPKQSNMMLIKCTRTVYDLLERVADHVRDGSSRMERWRKIYCQYYALHRNLLRSSRTPERLLLNVVRTMGQLIKCAPMALVATSVDHICGSPSRLGESIVNDLLQCYETHEQVKVRWNVCTTMGEIFKNADLYTAKAQEIGLWDRLEQLLVLLGNLAGECVNCKLRIAAVVALAQPQSCAYCSPSLYENTLAALYMAELNVDLNPPNDPASMAHRKSLVDALAEALRHWNSLQNVTTCE